LGDLASTETVITEEEENGIGKNHAYDYAISKYENGNLARSARRVRCYNCKSGVIWPQFSKNKEAAYF
jgi:hypothetical protein